MTCRCFSSRTPLYTTQLYLQPSPGSAEAAQAFSEYLGPPSAGAQPAQQRSLGGCGPTLRRRTASPFPSLGPLPASPSRSRPRGVLPSEETGRGEAPAHPRNTMYRPSRGAARRLGPCLRAYQARPQVRWRRPRGVRKTLRGAGEGRGAAPRRRNGPRSPFPGRRLTR